MLDHHDPEDRFGELAREEQVALAARDVRKLGEIVLRREKAMQTFFETGAQVREEAFLEKLTHMQTLNTRLRNEALALHQSLKEELLKLRSENRRLSGYHEGAVITPLRGRVMSKRG